MQLQSIQSQMSIYAFYISCENIKQIIIQKYNIYSATFITLHKSPQNTFHITSSIWYQCGMGKVLMEQLKNKQC